jgi:molecular chaperone DnaJ
MTARRTLDPYAVLGINRTATALQVARAHRRLAKRHHPDLHGASEAAATEAERMRRINEAWAILSNPTTRADYDRTHPSAGTPGGRPLGSVANGDQPGAAVLDADLGFLAGNGRRRRRPSVTRDGRRWSWPRSWSSC